MGMEKMAYVVVRNEKRSLDATSKYEVSIEEELPIEDPEKEHSDKLEKYQEK